AFDRDGVRVVVLSGDLDSATAAQVHDELSAVLPDKGSLLLDLGAMCYLSSAGLRVLLLLYRRAGDAGVRLGLANVPPDVHAVLSATGFLDAVLVVADVESGVEALRP